MNTWKRFSDEMPPEGACIETTAEDGLNAQLHREWKINFTTGYTFWWRIWDPPPKPVSAREEAYRRNSCIACAPSDSWFYIGWDAACDYIEKRMRERINAGNEIGPLAYLGFEAAANIAKEAKE